MKMVRHQDKLVKKIDILIAIVKQSFHKNLTSFWHLEYAPALPTLRGHEIRTVGSGPVPRRGYSLAFFRG